MSILCYHSIDSHVRSHLQVTPQSFDDHATWLTRHRRVLDLAEVVDHMSPRGRLPRRMCALTFDDGYASLYTSALPKLLHHRLPATVFVVAEVFGSSSAAQHPPFGPSDPPLSLEQALEMQQAGVRFGSHSYTHQDLTLLDEEECLRELRTSREVLEHALGTHIRFLAYPKGRHNAPVRRAAQKAGFTHCFGTSRLYPEFPLAIPRAGIYPGNGLIHVRAKTSRWYLPLRTSGAGRFLNR